MFVSEAVLVITQDVVHDKVVHYAAVDGSGSFRPITKSAHVNFGP